MKIACLGGGPGGVFFASQAKQHLRDAEVTVFERNRAEDTFGFGVVFSDSTLSHLAESDSILAQRLNSTGQYWQDIEVRIKGAVTSCGGNGMAAISRKQLLKLLYERAAEVGVDLKFQHPIDDLNVLDDYDFIVASDGANSIVRTSMQDAFRPRIEVAKAKFIWFGTTYKFNGLTFLFRESKDGIFAVHGYPIDESTGTFIVETDEDTWHRAGMDRFDASQIPGISDEYSRGYLEDLFSDEIAGSSLLVNNSRWGNFRTIKNASWFSGKYVLLGDSAHTAHFSVGSGTKMALEDASSLVRALMANPGDLDLAFEVYERERKMDVHRIQGSAVPSLSWWENFGRYYSRFDPIQFTFHFLTRAITAERLKRRDPLFVENAFTWWRSIFQADPIDTKFEFDKFEADGRLVEITGDISGSYWASFSSANGFARIPLFSQYWVAHQGEWGCLVNVDDIGTDAGLLTDQFREGANRNPTFFVVKGGNQVNRRMLCESIKLELNLPVAIVEEEFNLDFAQTVILSGRADFIGLER